MRREPDVGVLDGGAAATEAAIYRLMLAADTPPCDAFQRWVVQEVLPAIRKTGRYELDRRMPLPGPLWDALDER